jgi:hypothetical protein
MNLARSKDRKEVLKESKELAEQSSYKATRNGAVSAELTRASTTARYVTKSDL